MVDQHYTNNGAVGHADMQYAKTIFNAYAARSISIWHANGKVQGVSIAWNDGTRSEVIGQDRGNRNTLTLAPGETITHLSGWPTEDRSAPAGLFIRTSNRRDFVCGKWRGLSAEINKFDVGSGLLVAVTGNGEHVDGDLGATRALFKFDFYLPIRKLLVQSKHTLEDIQNGAAQMVSKVLHEQMFRNRRSHDRQYGYTGSAKMAIGTTFELALARQVGQKVKVSFEVDCFRIALDAATGTPRWEFDHRDRIKTMNYEATRKLKWETSVPIPAKRAAIWSARSWKGRARVPLTGTVTIRFADTTLSDITFNVSDAGGSVDHTDYSPAYTSKQRDA